MMREIDGPGAQPSTQELLAATQIISPEDLALTPEADAVSMLATIARFDEITNLAIQRNFSPETMFTFSAKRREWANARTTVWRAFATVDQAATNHEDPEFVQSFTDNQVKKGVGTIDFALFGNQQKPANIDSLMDGGTITCPLDYYKRLVGDNGLYIEDPGATEIRDAMTAVMGEWIRGERNEVAGDLASNIKALPVFDPEADIPAIADVLRANYYEAYLNPADEIIDTALDETIEQLRTMPAFDTNGTEVVEPEPKSSRQRKHRPTDYKARDLRTIPKFKAIRPGLDALEDPDTRGTLAKDVVDQFIQASGLAAFNHGADGFTSKAVTSAYQRLPGGKIDKKMAPFEDQIAAYWKTVRSRFRFADEYKAPEAEPLPELPLLGIENLIPGVSVEQVAHNKIQALPPTTPNVSSQADTIQSNVVSPEAKPTPERPRVDIENLVPGVSVEHVVDGEFRVQLPTVPPVNNQEEANRFSYDATRAVMYAAQELWGDQYKPIVISRMIHVLVTHARTRPNGLDSQRVFRHLAQTFYPANHHEKFAADNTASLREVVDIWDYADDGCLEFTGDAESVQLTFKTYSTVAAMRDVAAANGQEAETDEQAPAIVITPVH